MHLKSLTKLRYLSKLLQVAICSVGLSSNWYKQLISLDNNSFDVIHVLHTLELSCASSGSINACPNKIPQINPTRKIINTNLDFNKIECNLFFAFPRLVGLSISSSYSSYGSASDMIIE